MIPKLAAWALVGAVAYGVYVGVSGWKNPLSAPLPITTVLPPAYDGCGPSCKR